MRIDTTKQAAEPSETQINAALFCPRWIQLAVAGPSLLLWTFLAVRALIWCAGTGVMALLGRLPTNNWQVPYLAVMCLFTLACSGVTAFSLRDAFQGRSRLWWHAGTFGLGLILFVLLGIVGD
jgi:hypothetical protein